MKTVRFVIKVAVAVMLAFVVLVGGGVFYLTRGLNTNIQLSGVTKTELKDGTYIGRYTHGRWTNELEVTIQNGEMNAIKIMKDVVFSKEGLDDEVFSRVMEAQDTKIDVVSAATVTTKSYLKAIEIALENNK